MQKLLIRTAHHARVLLRTPERLSYASGKLSTSDLTLPAFLGIGVQKGGTTWLYRNLRCHPGLFLPYPKELHYFTKNMDQPLSWYAEHFKPTGDRLGGDVTPAYGAMPRWKVRYIRSILPEARLVLLLRDPVERAWSHAMMHLVRRSDRPFSEVPEEEVRQHLLWHDNRKHGNYVRILDNWLSVFPREQLFVGFFEELTERPEGLLSDVLRHIGAEVPASFEGYPLVEKANAGPGVEMPPVYRPMLEELYHDQIEELYRRFGDRVARWRVKRNG